MVSEGPGGQGPRRVVVVVLDAASASGIRRALDPFDDLECVGVARTKAGAVIDRTRADVVVVDLSMRDSIELVRRLRMERDDLTLVMISAVTDLGRLTAATVAGANGFAPKCGPVEELVAVLRSARPGRISVAPSVLPAATTAAQN
jgi:DNA-binding NarL/FixJ family response regulator